MALRNNLNNLTEGSSRLDASLNRYATKKTLAEGLLDVGLLMANASQLKTVITAGDAQQDFYWPLLILISLSILIQIVVGVLLIVLGNKELHDPMERNKANTINNVVTGIIFLSTVINIFIAAFGIKLSDDMKA